MTATAAPPATVSVDPQDALPESNWFWRRWFTFLLAAALCLLIHQATRLNAPPAVAIALVVCLCVLIITYVVAPSGEQVVKMVQIAGLLKGGISLTTTSTASSGGSVATTTTDAKTPETKPAETP